MNITQDKWRAFRDWLCPKCGSVWAYWITGCPVCEQEAKRSHGGDRKSDQKDAQIDELKHLLGDVLRYLDVSVSGEEARALCDRIEEVLQKLNQR